MFLIKNKILAPNLLRENYINNYIEIQDFGDQTLLEILSYKKNNKLIAKCFLVIQKD